VDTRVALCFRSPAPLRGLEEACHHSQVLRETDGELCCARVGLRVLLDEDLDPLREHFAGRGCATAWADVPHQSRTLYVDDPVGIRLEFCASMPVLPWMLTEFAQYRGGCAQRLDHFQLYVSDPMTAVELYAGAGFRISEYIADDDDELVGAFLQRKSNPHDLVFFRDDDAPRLHHVAYTTTSPGTLLHACDVASSLGFGDCIERGPGRHGPGHA
jgi:catechol 2,3-dioxygenase